MDVDMPKVSVTAEHLMSLELVGIRIGSDTLAETNINDNSSQVSNCDYSTGKKSVCKSDPRGITRVQNGFPQPVDQSTLITHFLTPESAMQDTSRTASVTSDFSEYTDCTSDCSSTLFVLSDGDESSNMSVEGSRENIRRRSSISSCAFSCREHPLLQMALFCIDCAIPVCLKCKLVSHGEHKVTTLINAATEQLKKLKDLERNLNSNSLNLNNSLAEHENYRQSLVKNRQTIMDKLDKRRTYLHRLVDRWHGKIQLQVDAVFSYEMAKIDAQIEDISERLSEMKDNMEHLSQILAHTQAGDLLALSQDLLETEQEEFSVPKLVELYFLFNSGNGLNYSDFGDFTAGHQENTAGTQLVSTGKLKFSFDSRSEQTSRYAATGLSLTTNGNLLVTDLGLDRVHVFQANGKKVVTLDTLPTDEPSSAAMLQDKNIVVSCRSGMKLYDQQGNFVRKLKDCADCPNSLHVSNLGDLIVTDHAHDGPFIHIFDSDMNLKNTIIGGIRAPSFHQPWYVTSDSNGQIIVSDCTEHNVKIFNKRGILLSEFGRQGAQVGCFFRPAGVCVDRYNNILVADSGNNRVQMFTAEGKFCAVLLTDDEHELSKPMDLAVDEQGNLLVLQSNGIIATYKYIY